MKAKEKLREKKNFPKKNTPKHNNLVSKEKQTAQERVYVSFIHAVMLRNVLRPLACILP